jgi:hypothetical protein
MISTTKGKLPAGREDELAAEPEDEATLVAGGLLVAGAVELVVWVAAADLCFLCLCVLTVLLAVVDGGAVVGAPLPAAFELSGAGVVVTGAGGASAEPPEPDAAVPGVATPEFDPDDAW